MSLKTIALSLLFCTPTILLCKETRYHGQWKQDRYMNEHFFHNKKQGTFVDIGAHNGVTISNSLFYEKKLGWQGICVEPMPKIFKELRGNRSCICIQGCITDARGQKDFLHVASPRVNTEMLSGLLEKYDPKHLARVDREIAQHGGYKEIIKVECYTFNEIMRTHNITHIDYLSIDTEGGELDILKTIDFDTIAIHIIDVENNFPENTGIKKFLTSKGFHFVTRIKCDEVYCNRSY